MSPSPIPQPYSEDPIFRDRVRRAREMSPGQKLLVRIELFELSCEIARAGIRAQSPELDDEGVEQELRRRLEIQRRLQEKDLYRPYRVEDLESSP
jgi:hypothetical protein